MQISNFSRRHFLLAGGSVALASRLAADIATTEEKNKLPVIP